ncbi:MAG TPA: SPOR domain-containing protein, partial [Edaphobacter sp.]|nr:SPOR domain-containing protein [Edaphobacter sp.]
NTVSAVYNFSLDRGRALLLAGCTAAAAVLLFFAGSISGILYSGGRPILARATQPAPIAKPMQSPAANPKNAAAPAALAASPIIASEAAQTSAPAAGALASSAVEAAPVPQEPASATVSVASTAETKTEVSTPAALNAEAKPHQAVVAASRPVEASYAIPLAVKVGSFSVRENAEGLMQSLKDRGYRPMMSRSSDSGGRVWYVVKLGPYTCWNAASRVAAQVSIAENLRPVIGPVQ